MEKFSLKWNDFESNASKSFRNLRKEDHFYDVTLVSDDEHLVPAHKIVLSASSEFFKNILKKSTHSNPLVYLPWIRSADLNSIIDYIYNGEAQVYQDNLDTFLDVAQKLKIEGLNGGENNQKHEQEEIMDDEMDMSYSTNKKTGSNILMKTEGVDTIPKRTKSFDYEISVSFLNQDYSKEELTKAIDDLIVKDGSIWYCKTCGKTSNSHGNMRKHVEIHIEGLSYPCPNCDNTFRSRNVLKHHRLAYHQNH